MRQVLLTQLEALFKELAREDGDLCRRRLDMTGEFINEVVSSGKSTVFELGRIDIALVGRSEKDMDRSLFSLRICSVIPEG